jgi:hypothetical protein
MAIRLERDHERRIMTVTVTDPYTIDDLFAVLDRLAAEDAWDYAVLYDVRAVAEATWFDPASVNAHVLKAGEGRPLGPSALIVGEHAQWFKDALKHPWTAMGFPDHEVLVTPAQVVDWTQRHSRRRR